jgi:lathosterol oxidase
MDVLLDVLDTFVFDRLYAAILRDTTADSGATQSSHLNQHVKVYFPLEPSSWAEASLLKRDNMARQTLSLFLMIWYVSPTLS